MKNLELEEMNAALKILLKKENRISWRSKKTF